jgi:NTP pyrophosphatase (non-canonical NTP hydrolase)
VLVTNKNMYNIYHIPGKKIGVTRNLNKRVTEQQGYAPDEYEVLFTSDDINLISNKEIELQQSYGYRKDRTLYKNLFKSNMRINPTEQTSTFPVPINKLKGNLMDNVGLEWETPDYKFKLEKEHIPWIMQNAKTSMFNDDRSYIYNKAFYEAFFNLEHNPAYSEIKTDQITTNNVFDLIRDWATVRGIYDNGDSKTQYVKLMEEAGELAQALLNNDKEEIQDAIGDMVVVLTSIAKFEGLTIEDCIDSAYNVIAKRKGKMINGTFVKETL